MSKYLLSLFIVVTTTFSQSIPTPEEILGYNLGERFTSHGKIEQYLHALERSAGERVRVSPYGESYEGRTLYRVVFSSPENLNRLEEIRSAINKLSDPRTTTPAEAAKIITSTPAIAWLSYGVHGNEASSSEAALNVMYTLASGTDEGTLSLLKNLVIVIDPLLNPDGHERYVNYELTRTGSRPVEERAAVVHNEDWPSGRTNHYFFDLNRDWAWLTQRESRARIKAYREWMPQVHVDFHEMSYNSSYFFFPAFKPINKNFPSNTIEWGEIYGRGNAAAFDSAGTSYWSGESFDMYYPGYGDSWPSLHGAIGMTYEQAGQVGVRIKRADESVLTLSDRLSNHTATSFATLKTTATYRERRLRDFYQFFRDAIDEGKRGSVSAYVISPGSDPHRAAKMVSLLMEQGVEVYTSEREFSLDDARTYFTPLATRQRFPSGSYIIPLDQPAKRLITALMEQEPILTDTVFYDISAWTLPIAYGVRTYWSATSPSVPMKKAGNITLPSGSVVGGKATYAYIIPWKSNEAIKVLVKLLQEDYRVHVAMREFGIDGSNFDRGSMIVPVGGNKAGIHERIKQLAEEHHLAITAAQSGFTENGINLGSDRAVRLKKPKILVVTGLPVGTEAYGAIWSMFDLEYGIDFVPIKLSQLRNTDLHSYTAMIFPDDNAGGNSYRSQIDSNFAQRIKAWITGGGTFIGIEGGAVFASTTQAKIAGVKIKEKKKDEKKDEEKKKDEKLSDEELEKRMTVEEKERKSRLEEIPGTMMRVKLDNTHPIGFGYDKSIEVLKATRTMFELSESGYNVGIYTKSPRLSGYISSENEKKLEETPYIIHEQLGSGNVILFADDPNFRLFWDGLNKLFLNSVLVMPSIRDVSLTAE